MTWEIAVTLAVLAAVVFALTFLRTSPDLILLAGLVLLFVAGIIDTRDALAGFANEGLITVGILFIVADGLSQTGAISYLGQRLLGQPKSIRSAQSLIMSVAALISAFLNNTPVVAMMMPVVGDWAKKYRLSVSHLFLPLSYATILGGMCTLIGTSTNLVVNGLLIEAKQPAFRMFDLAWVGVPTTAAGLLYLLISAKWLLPERKPASTQLDDPREYTVEMMVAEGSTLVGRTIEQAGRDTCPACT
jgi:di/tricarboxylate transporter